MPPPKSSTRITLPHLPRPLQAAAAQQAASSALHPDVIMTGFSLPGLHASTSVANVPPPIPRLRVTRYLCNARFDVYKDGAKLTEAPLPSTRPSVFGRGDAEACGVTVTLDHPSSSRRHATVEWDPRAGAFCLTDLGSAHGTFVGGRRLAAGERAPLGEGDVVRFGASSREYVAVNVGVGPGPPSRQLDAGRIGCPPPEVTIDSHSPEAKRARRL